MRAVIQRVSSATIKTESGHEESMSLGIVVLLGVEALDNEEDIEWLTGKIVRLRIFDDQEGIMNLSLQEINGSCMVVSQFTLHASTKKGNRPSYIRAATPEIAVPLYESFLVKMQEQLQKPLKKGVFGDHMDLSLVNDGPVTIVIDTKRRE